MDLTLSNIGRTVKIKIGSINLQYLGPKNLIKFNKITNVVDGVLYVDTKFRDEKGSKYNEEDYIDIRDLLNEFEYDTEAIISSINRYIVEEKKNMKKEDLINSALLVSDNFALIPYKGSTSDKRVFAVNMTKSDKKALINVEDCTVLSSNMNKNMLNRAIGAVERNKNMVLRKM